jgi:hypothetical protein
MEITEGNKLIAEFMGAKLVEHAGGDNVYEFKESPQIFAGLFWQPEHMAYPVSWEWLMPVVEKIDQVVVDGRLHTVEMKNGECKITWDDPFKNRWGTLIQKENNRKIQAVWQAVVAFIQWYNQQPK